MEIVIHGTKDGYRTLYSTDSELAYLIAKDMRSGANEDKQLGQSVYALAFASNGLVYSKYIIIKDTQRSNAIGTISFTLFLNYDKVLKGLEIKKLLDDLSKIYSEKYIINNYLNRGEKNLIREDWTFVNDVLSNYKEQGKIRNYEEMQSGKKDAAFIYYKGERELQEYFDKPFQQEYCDYEQVLYANKDLKDTEENPLKSLRNSGVELKGIDLENEYYYLNSYNRSKEVTIKADGKQRSDRKNNNCIRAKWPIEISYSKDPQCFYPIEATGTLSNLQSKIHEYLDIKGNQIRINYDAFKNPEPIPKALIVKIADRKGNPIDDVEISCKNKYSQIEKEVNGSKLEFKGSELREHWCVIGKKGDFIGEVEFTPKLSDETVLLILEERNIVTIKVKDKNTNVEIDDFEVWTKLTGGYKKINKLEFVDDQILDSFTIIIRKYGYEDENYDNFQPHRQNILDINLKKKNIGPQNTSFIVNSGENGNLIDNNSYFSNLEDGSDVHDIIVPEKGYVFTHFIKENNTLIAQYNKKKSIFQNSKVITGGLIGVIILGFGIGLFFLFNKPGDLISNQEIENYVKGNDLFFDKLDYYKEGWEKQKPEVSKKSEGIFDLLFFWKKEPDSTDYKKWDKVNNSIEYSIDIRKYINAKDFEKLKNLNYSSNQENFELAIKKIDSTNNDKVKTDLLDVSESRLTTITNKINNILKLEEVLAEEKELDDGEQKESIPVSSKKSDVENKELHLASETKAIRKALKGSDITKKELTEYSNKHPKDKSFQLYLEFWAQVERVKPIEDYTDLHYKVKRDYVLKNSDLEKFLQKICKNPTAFENFSNLRGRVKYETLDELKEAIKI